MSKHERLFANLQRFYTPFDKLRANAASADEMIVNRLLDGLSINWVLCFDKLSTNGRMHNPI